MSAARCLGLPMSARCVAECRGESPKRFRWLVFPVRRHDRCRATGQAHGLDRDCEKMVNEKSWLAAVPAKSTAWERKRGRS